MYRWNWWSIVRTDIVIWLKYSEFEQLDFFALLKLEIYITIIAPFVSLGNLTPSVKMYCRFSYATRACLKIHSIPFLFRIEIDQKKKTKENPDSRWTRDIMQTELKTRADINHAYYHDWKYYNVSTLKAPLLALQSAICNGRRLPYLGVLGKETRAAKVITPSSQLIYILCNS